MLRTTARLATVALLALAITACSSDEGSKDEEVNAAGQGVETPEQIAEQLDAIKCDVTQLELTWNTGKRKGETVQLDHATALVKDNGAKYSIWASDEELNAGPLPEAMPIVKEDAALATLEVHVVDEKAAKKQGPIERTKVYWSHDAAALGFHVVASQGKQSSMAFPAAEGSILIPEPQAEEGQQLCVAVDYADGDKSLTGTFVTQVAAVRN